MKIKALIILLIFSGVFLLFRKDADKSLIRNGVVLNGKTLSWGVVSKGYNLKYEFYYKGEKIINGHAIEKIRGLKIFENKYFPVIYENSYGLSEILIDPETFKKYKEPFPDSLNWVLPYFEK